MRTKVSKSVTMILAVSIASAGPVISAPNVYAATDAYSVTSAAEEYQSTSSNLLSELGITEVQLDQTFSSTVKEYTATVENSVASIHLLLKSDNDDAAIKIDGQSVEGGEALLPLEIGENTFSITVDDGDHTVNTYTLTVTRKQSSNNLLSNLKLSKGKLSPVFEAETTSYSVQVASDVDQITVTPVSADKTASILVNSGKADDSGVSVKLPVGKTKITILVTAQNGEKKTYTIEVTRPPLQTGTAPNNAKGSTPQNMSGLSSNKNMNTAPVMTQGLSNLRNGNSSSSQQSSQQVAGNAAQQPSKALLSALTVSSGTWNKTFAEDTFTYHIAVDSDTDSVTISETPKYSSSSISIEGGSSKTISLGNQKKTIISVVVTNDDEEKTYVLVFDKDISDTDTTTEATATTSTTSNSADSTNTDSVSKSSAVGTSQTAASTWNGKQNTTSTSFWSRLIENIRSFFSKL